ncbi:MAG: NAD(P)H-dependent oxidoreductase [Alkalibacterium sp.]|nr:NAD(P)H-dependent oxidoreductase [Alkalibacterium sp.]
MKTLIILSHPTVDESGSQQFLIHSLPEDEDITLHVLEKTYPDGLIDVEKEQALLLEHDRILFQFPFYWYSSPPLLKKWQDEVLTDHFAFGYRGNRLHGKEFGLVLVIGLPEKDYQSGGQEGFSISELTKPLSGDGKEDRHDLLEAADDFPVSVSVGTGKKEAAYPLPAVSDTKAAYIVKTKRRMAARSARKDVAGDVGVRGSCIHS